MSLARLRQKDYIKLTTSNTEEEEKDEVYGQEKQNQILKKITSQFS